MNTGPLLTCTAAVVETLFRCTSPAVTCATKRRADIAVDRHRAQRTSCEHERRLRGNGQRHVAFAANDQRVVFTRREGRNG